MVTILTIDTDFFCFYSFFSFFISRDWTRANNYMAPVYLRLPHSFSATSSFL